MGYYDATDLPTTTSWVHSGLRTAGFSAMTRSAQPACTDGGDLAGRIPILPSTMTQVPEQNHFPVTE